MAGPRGTTGQMETSPDILMDMKLLGQWREANYMFQRWPIHVDRAFNRAIRSFNIAYRKQIIKNINNNGAEIGWKPYSEDYEDFKEAYSTSSGFYRFFGVLASSIRTYKTSNGWVTGIPKDIRNNQMEALQGGSTLTVAEYAAVNEFGSPSRNISARPLWYPSFTQLGGTPAVRRTVQDELRKEFRHVSKFKW